MSDDLSSVIHALLIGIDYYQPNPLYPSLKGAVRDICLVEAFLQQSLGVPAERILKLTSPQPEDSTLLAVRSGGGTCPTYANIVGAFATITARAQPGDQVYIHYSGHGGRAATVYPQLKQGMGEQYDEALVPMDIGNGAEGRYLRDVEMTTLLRRMVDKLLVVTVVLDSCHAGGATRGVGDVQIRSATTPDTRVGSADSLVAPLEELQRNWLELSGHQVVGGTRLPPSQNYVLLAACRPNEFAYEYAVNGGGERHGALTYWMIDTLTGAAANGQPLTYKLLHDRINAQIQSKFPLQLPMIVGDSDRRVFGRDTWATPYTVNVIRVDSRQTQVTLSAGQAQGLSKGTRFAIYPLNTTDFTDQSQAVAIVEISQRPEASESTAKVLGAEAGGMAQRGSLEPGAPAVMLSAPIDLVQPVRLFDQKLPGQGDNQLPPDLVPGQRAALDQVRRAMAGNGWVVEAQAEESALYQVAVDRQGNYEICRGMPIPNLRPPLAINDPAAASQVVQRLVHLARYQAVHSLDNASSKLGRALQVELLTEDGAPFANPQNPVVQDGDLVTLRLTNQGAQPLKLAVLDMEPTWEISQIPLGGLQSPFFPLDPGAQEELQLKMQIPADGAYDQATETLKVFAVQTGLADFRWLTLPPLDEIPQPRGAALEEGLRGQGTTRGGLGEGVNPLNQLLSMIGADLDQAPNQMRSAVLVTNPKDDWVTHQLTIVVNRG